MNPMITIDDTDEEVIDLDSSQDTINVADNDQSEHSIESNSLSNNTVLRTDTANENAEANDQPSEPQTSDNADTPKPLLKVMFRDEGILRLYRKRIKEFLEELTSSKVKCEENDDSLSLEIWDQDVDSRSQSVEVTTESEDSQDIICDAMFTVDTQPQMQDDFDVPTYGKKYENVFEKANAESKSEPKDERPPQLMCFNCLENHNLRDCPKPRNRTNIMKNRKSFNMKGNTRTLRYHLNDDQKFGRIVPGQLSSNLRRALGLKDNELPRHIYRMRTLGYPPGWLEEARLQHSGISLFNSEGVAENDPNDKPEQTFQGDKDQYDVKKIYDFPGFNVPPPPGTRDENGQYWASQMQTVHSKQTMLSLLNGKMADDGYKRKKLKVSNSEVKENPAASSTEMDIDDAEGGVVESVLVNGLFVPPLPLELPVKPQEPPLPPTPETSDCQSQELQFVDSPIEPEVLSSNPILSSTNNCPRIESESHEMLQENSASPSSRVNSPSLSDLENMKKQLLVALQESNSQSNSQSNTDVLQKISSSNSPLKSSMPPPSNEVTPELNRTRRNTLNTSHGNVKSMDLGTPVLQSTSPYNKLPSSENFSKDICDVINFENLPDSTGKYEQMTGVLQKVRTALAKLHQE